MAKLRRNLVNSNYEGWLNQYDWQFFTTFTTPYEMTLKTARRNMERYHKHLRAAGNCPFFWVAEPFEVKEGYHTHALLAPPTPYTFKMLVDLWQEVSGAIKRDQWARIDLQNFDPKRGGAGYVSKYVLKAAADYDFHR